MTEWIDDNVSENDVKEEANCRASRQGYCTRLGEPVYSMKIMTIVPFGKEKLNVWPRDRNGNLIE